MKKKRPVQEYDEVPKRKQRHGLHVLMGLSVLALALIYWWSQPAPPVLHAQDLSIHGLHLGENEKEVIARRGKAGTDRKMPGGFRDFVYAAGERYTARAERLIYLETRGSGGVQLPHSEIKVGDSRDSIEKLLGVVEPVRNAAVTQITWPGPDCRLRVEFDADWKAQGFRVYSP